ncbi:flagellin [Acetoanaerobium noterae]|uniref:flagellin N-terminal helical domain-containing protein n=1 Tax=Acetoanaerobium noterae TaxID=745369 RepID=UPI0028AF6C60|nr:flagellin [Acetoanaerobium noterae]
MRINTNIAALNSHRMLEKNTSISGRNLEKLSSGKRINRASDDAAGLAISEKMNAQIRGLKMASRNALDGVSLVQTAEGAMGEVHSMLQRMRELSVQAANGTMSPDDRRAIQDEINQLTSEVNRIGNGTEFNKLNILQGNQGPESNTIINKMSTGEPAQVVIGAITTATPFNPKTTPFQKLTETDTLSVIVNDKETIVNLQGFSTSTNLSYGDFLERINDALGDDAVAYFNDNGSILVKTNQAGGGQSIEFKGSQVTLDKLFPTPAGAVLTSMSNIIIDSVAKTITIGTGTPQPTESIKIDGDTYVFGNGFIGSIEIGTTSETANRFAHSINSRLGNGTVSAVGNVITWAGDFPDKIEFGAKTFTINNNFNPGESIRVGNEIFTFGDGTGGTVLLGLDEISTATNLEIAMNANPNIGAFTRINNTISWTTVPYPIISDVKYPGPKAFGTAENPANKSEGTIFFSEMPEKGSFITIGNTRIDFYDSSEEPYAGTNVPIDLNASANVEALVTNLISNLNIDGVTLSAVPGNARTINIEADVVGFAGNVITLEGTLEEFNVNLQVGSNAGQGFRLEVGDTRSIALKISANKPTGNPGVAGAAYVEIPNVTNGIKPAFVEYSLDVMDEDKATAAIEVFNNAIITVASERSKLGAIQNRLEKTIANLDNTAENLTAAKSRIEDTDMALEMSEFTKFNILQQAGTAMLAQANQQPQMMLQLLNG